MKSVRGYVAACVHPAIKYIQKPCVNTQRQQLRQHTNQGLYGTKRHSMCTYSMYPSDRELFAECRYLSTRLVREPLRFLQLGIII